MLQRWWRGVLVTLMVLVAGRWLGLHRYLMRLAKLVAELVPKMLVKLLGRRPGGRSRGFLAAAGHDKAALIGQTAVVEQPMAPGGQGQVAVAGTVYLARNVGGDSLPIGITCRVTAIDHLTLWVIGDA